MTRLLIIAGPTACGKTSISLDIATKFNGEIICCDSMQIYKDMNIGTAKVTAEEQAIVKHHLVDFVNVDERFSVGDYQKQATSVINNIIMQSKLPILVGGTGLYIDSVIYPFGLGDSATDTAIREQLNNEYNEVNGAKTLHDRLMSIDPVDGLKIHPNNRIRLIRALEIYKITGKSKTELSKDNKRMSYDVLMIIPNIDRDVLYDRINRRVDMMFDSGLQSEVDRIVNSYSNAFELQSMQAIGYKEFKGLYDNSLTIEQIKMLIKQNSRNYAKRQITWLKNKYPFAVWCNPDEFEGVIKSTWSNN